jgi:hypothetical protein
MPHHAVRRPVAIRRPEGLRIAPATIVLIAFAAACATNPVTGRRELSLKSEAQEI